MESNKLDLPDKQLDEDTQHVEDATHKDVTFVSTLDSIESTKTDYYIWLVAITVGVGGFLFGYDTGIISAVLVVLDNDLGHVLVSSEKELITSITSGGAFLGALAAGFSADKFGRKLAIDMGCVVFVIGAVIQACSYSIAQMTVGRFVIGVGVGSAAMIIPLYIAEVSPAKYRGRMIGLDNMSITGGQLVAYGLGAGLADVSHGWRYMVGLGAVPAIILAICLRFCPESPRQLIYHGKSEEAARVLAKIFPNATENQVQEKVQHLTIHIEEALAMTDRGGIWRQLKTLYTVSSNFRALIVACGLMGMQQFTGYNTLMYYSSTLFGLVGFSNPIAVGTIIAGTGFGCTLVYFLIIDRFGRRFILLATMWGMSLFLALAAVGFHWIPVKDDLTLEKNVVGWPGYLVLAAMIIFVVFYSLGIGNLAWFSSEIFPIEIRALGTMMMTCTCWGGNIVVASTFLTQMENTTPSGAFGFYAALCFVGWVGVYFCYPEVKGMTLEDIREIFNHGFGVEYARNVQKEMRQRQAEANRIGV
ncbi:general substrate transporter [Penicillium brevicompactum]|uniref:general substrate transporter n=1 Tax=Penicillium brevicompactum TaxID=5074 RepID=UPI0025408F25|nr:general substrate transporter [Penicillium brevicompactum]KAJ5334125.1 general substrate transporter [Penicillium brevicompactum]